MATRSSSFCALSPAVLPTLCTISCRALLIRVPHLISRHPPQVIARGAHFQPNFAKQYVLLQDPILNPSMAPSYFYEQGSNGSGPEEDQEICPIRRYEDSLSLGVAATSRVAGCVKHFEYTDCRGGCERAS
ncbi:hypothetical protein K456DRAFT_1155507 [Colletotrichum gloeosporioides 23]|nr:hypothetical protein K456DRAFT_1155507 [Colletotrichum gloeosporioides 23]